MNRILLCIIMVILFLSCKENYREFTINGTIEDAQGSINIYFKNDHTGIVEDSTITDNNGNFTFKGTTEYPQRYSIIYQSDRGQKNHFVWVENITIEIIGKLSEIENIKIKGGSEQKLSDEMYREWSAFFYPEYNRLINEKKSDSIGFLINKAARVRLDFCIKNPNSYMAIEAMYQNRNGISKDSLRLILKELDDSILSSKYGKSLLLYSKNPELDVGKHYIDFTVKTLTREDIRISELLKERKPILLIFGGLYCMGEHGRKTLKEFHTSYKDNIEVLVFVTTNSADVCNRDSEYDLNIPLITDMKGDHSLIKIQYDIIATPTVYLINKDGIITWISEGYGNNVNEAAIQLFDQ